MAQDYHAYFGCDEIECETIGNVQVGEKIQIMGKDKKERTIPINEQVVKKERKRAKDELGIEQRDFFRDLDGLRKSTESKKVKEQEERIFELEGKIIEYIF